MKKLISFFAVACMLTFIISSAAFAQEANEIPEEDTTELAEEVTEAPAETLTEEEPVEEAKTFHQVLKEKFIEGGAGWMTPILICLILGLALVIERIIYLNLASTNTKKLLVQLEDKLAQKVLKVQKNFAAILADPLPVFFIRVWTEFRRTLK
jgi:biopolymer transport protein ExbB